MPTSKKTARKISLGAALCFAAAALLTCEKVPEYCGQGTGPNSWLRERQFCYGDRAYDLCRNNAQEYNPLIAGCVARTGEIGTRCFNDAVVPVGSLCGDYTVSAAAVPADVGSVSLNPNYATYREGDTVEITRPAFDTTRYTFVEWAGALLPAKDTAATTTMTVSGASAAISVTAMFKPKDANNAATFRLITSAIPKDGGGVRFVTPGRPGSTNGNGIYAKDTTVTLKAEGLFGYKFDRWAGDIPPADAANPEPSIRMNSSKALVAIFKPDPSARKTVTLRITVSPEKGGAVFINGAAVSGDVPVDSGIPVLFTAKAAAEQGYVFSDWDVLSESTSDTVTLKVGRSGSTLTAKFKKGTAPYTPPDSPADTTPTPPAGGGSDSTFTDGRDGNTYKKVKIGSQTWMAENLNFNTDNSWCYNNSADSCAKYGRLYTWAAAKTACPTGWRLPDTADWNLLVETAGGPLVAAKVLKSTSGWGNDGNGVDTYGFSALPGGRRYPDGIFDNIRGGGNWWTSTGSDWSAYYRRMDYRYDYVSENVNENEDDRYHGLSVRCLLDEGTVSPPITPPIGNEPNNCGVDGTDRNCKTVTIGGQVWMAQNLNIRTTDSWCYGEGGQVVVGVDGSGRPNEFKTLSSSEIQANCNKYGRLYTWAAAKSACQLVGWRLPDTTDRRRLVTVAGGLTAAGITLKSTSGWNGNRNGTDNLGFSGLPGGGRTPDNMFASVGDVGFWWTATADDHDESDPRAFLLGLSYQDDAVVLFGDPNKVELGISVRCVANN